MSVHLITGFAGKEHITSADQGSFNAAVMGGGEFVLERGEQFRCQVVSNNKVRIYDGDALMQGRHVMIDRNTYEETTHSNGTQGYKRIDLIVLTYEKDAVSSVETAKIEVIEGAPASSNPAVPEYTTGDILNGGASKNQMPLYQIPFDGLSIGEPVRMFSTVETLEGMKRVVDSEVAAKMKELDQKFNTLESGIDEKIQEAGKPLSSSAEDWSMIEKYGEYSADAKTVGEEFAKVENKFGGVSFGVDGEGNPGYLGADGSLVPFSSIQQIMYHIKTVNTSGDANTGVSFDTYLVDTKYPKLISKAFITVTHGAKTKPIEVQCFEFYYDNNLGLWTLIPSIPITVNGVDYGVGEKITWYYQANVDYKIYADYSTLNELGYTMLVKSAVASTEFSSGYPVKFCYDENKSNVWLPLSTDNSPNVTFEFESAFTLTSIKALICNSGSSTISLSGVGMTISGSNNKSTWEQIGSKISVDTVISFTGASSANLSKYQINGNKLYKYYKVTFDKATVGIAEIKFYGR